MATSKRQFTLRLQDTNFEKISCIASLNKRSTTMQIEWLIENYIANYEKDKGVIIIRQAEDLGSETLAAHRADNPMDDMPPEA